MHWFLKKCADRPGLRCTQATLCLILGGCGSWSLIGAGLIMAQDEPTFGSAAIALVLGGYGLACFAIIFGLWRTHRWALPMAVVLSVAMLIADIAALYMQGLLLDARVGLLAFPLAFAGFTFWQFSKFKIAAIRKGF